MDLGQRDSSYLLEAIIFHRYAALLGFAPYFVLFEPFCGYSGFSTGDLASGAVLHGLPHFTFHISPLSLTPPPNLCAFAALREILFDFGRGMKFVENCTICVPLLLCAILRFA